MASCEYCWDRSAEYRDMPTGAYSDGYKATLANAEANNWSCCERDADGNLTENARRLRAGQFWDEATKSDRRTTKGGAE